MSDQKPPKDFPYPLDTDIEEQIPVRKVTIDEVDERTGSAKFSMKTVMEKQNVRYIHAPKIKHRCKSGEHRFRVLNKQKGIFGCKKCQFAVKIHPANYTFKEGKITHRRSGKVV